MSLLLPRRHLAGACSFDWCQRFAFVVHPNTLLTPRAGLRGKTCSFGNSATSKNELNPVGLGKTKQILGGSSLSGRDAGYSRILARDSSRSALFAGAMTTCDGHKEDVYNLVHLLVHGLDFSGLEFSGISLELERSINIFLAGCSVVGVALLSIGWYLFTAFFA